MKHWKIAGIVDVETTGLSPHTQEIVELCLALFSFDPYTGQIIQIVEEYCSLREPSIPIPAQATAIHGITTTAVRGKRLDHPVLETMFAKAEFLIAHNASFDRGFISQLFPSTTAKTWLCSMNGIDWKGMGFQSKGLQNLLTYHGIKPSAKHRAEHDVKAVLELLSYNGNENGYFSQLIQAYIRQAGNNQPPETKYPHVYSVSR